LEDASDGVKMISAGKLLHDSEIRQQPGRTWCIPGYAASEGHAEVVEIRPIYDY